MAVTTLDQVSASHGWEKYAPTKAQAALSNGHSASLSADEIRMLKDGGVDYAKTASEKAKLAGRRESRGPIIGWSVFSSVHVPSLASQLCGQIRISKIVWICKSPRLSSHAICLSALWRMNIFRR